MSLKSYVCWVCINAVGIGYFACWLWLLFNPQNTYHNVFLTLHLTLSGALLGIFFLALFYIKWTTPVLDDPRWHGKGSSKTRGSMAIDISIESVNQRMKAL